jgi:hypothetical protein
VSELLPRLLTVGADPHDDEDTRLRKFLLLVAAKAITPPAVVWGALDWIVGAAGAAAIPWLYVLISLVTEPALAAVESKYAARRTGKDYESMTKAFGRGIMVSRRDIELDREVVTVPAGVLLALLG